MQAMFLSVHTRVNRQTVPRLSGFLVMTIGLLIGSSVLLCALPKKNYQQSIKEEKRRLERLEKSIDATRKKLNSVKKQESATVKKLNLIRRQNEELNSYIVLLQREQARVEDSIANTEQSLALLERHLRTVQREYADLVRAIHKAGRAPDEELLVTGRNRGEEQRQTKYMQNITALAGRKADEIARLKDSIEYQKLSMIDLLDKNTTLIENERARLEDLSEVIIKREETLAKIRSNASALKKQIAQKTGSAKKLKRIVALLVEKERKRKTEEKRRRESRGGGFTGDRAPSKKSAAGFAKGGLPWPVNSKKITSKFGKQKNPKTGIATENLGIGIKIPRGSTVKAVAAGTVSLVHWLPGYGSLVIVDHGNDYRTVYANLSSVHITEGQRVNTGTMLGKSGKSVDGEYLHFEIWRNRDVMDPAPFLQ